MKKLGSSLALLALLGASHLHASEQADGFNWPYGFAAQPAVEQFDAADGLNWPMVLPQQLRNLSR
ncbi:hypothetical protein [Candidatus Reidiella endopervernicosa]|uniref:Uncharacterized protein n=1 Tax=Candidatus Reidiella endopervernicosa TaxID=2738883 RepID=A0A6N0HTM7_9GAMM|nr:hypothetical protein [Candidatus Reidiella endopervernicosa]QKQ25763.1 hypothetical protein HUE57_05295 [Candidatus Reidiella endopervernicosa]